MTTPLLMIAILLTPWLASRLWPRLGKRWPPERAAVHALALLFLFTASGHFMMADAMVQMLPPWVPARLPLVWATGVLEIAIAIGLLVPRLQRAAGGTALAVLIGFFPANVYAAWQQLPMGGHAWGLVYLWVRAPLQALLIYWTWRFALGCDLSLRARAALLDARPA